MTFGEALREVRRETGVTQRELAERVGVDFTYISKLENGRNPAPAADTIVRICHALDIAPERLLSLTGKLPSDVQQTIGQSRAAQEFLRETQKMNLSDDEWRQLNQGLQRLRGDD